MIYTKKIAVDLSHQYLNDVIRLHEGDASGSQIRIEVFDNGSAFDLTAYTVKYDAVIAGYLAEEDHAATVSNNTITVPITGNMCAKSGTLAIDVKIIEGSGQTAKVMFLQKFEAFVQRRVINEDVIIDVSGTTIGAKIAALEAKFPVATADIADAAVIGDKIGTAAVTSTKIASGAVTSGKIDSGAVTAGKIADGAVTTAKIADGNITTAKIADGNITTAKLADSSVTTAKVADGAVTAAKLAEDYGKITVMSYADASALNFTLPQSYAGNLGDIVIMTTGTGSGGKIWQLEKTVTAYGTTSYFWIALASAADLTALANLVGNANDLLEAALNYQAEE